MKVSYSVEGGLFKPDKPTAWSEKPIALRNRFGSFVRPFDIHPDGARIFGVPLQQDDAPRNDHVVLMFDFLERLGELFASR